MASGTEYFFTEEIMSMMHAFGDCSQPMPESARLIESIIHEQMDAFIEKADEVRELRGSPAIGAEDILFLMRKDKPRLVRLINHLYVKDIKQAFNASNSNINDNSAFDKANRSQTKRVRICSDYLCKLDEFSEYKKVFNQALFCEVRNQRMRRLDSMTRNMTSQEYSNFTRARQVSFISKMNADKFRDWLLVNRPMKLEILAFEMLQYLAHETVAQLVDLALLVKQDAERDPHDPLSVLITKSAHNRNYKPINQLGHPQLRDANHPCRAFHQGQGAKPAAQPTCITPSNIHEAVRRYCCDPQNPYRDFRVKDKNSSMVILCI